MRVIVAAQILFITPPKTRWKNKSSARAKRKVSLKKCSKGLLLIN